MTSQPPSKKGSNRRRTYVVNPNFQLKYTLILASAVFLVSALLSFGLFGMLHAQARSRVINPTAPPVGLTTTILAAATAYSILTAGVAAFWMLLTTHRVCGPLYVLEQNFLKIANGEVPKLRALRKKDEFKDLFKTFSTAVDRIREDKAAHLAAVNAALSAAQSNCTGEAEYHEALATVTRHLNQLRDELTTSLGDPGRTSSDASVVPAAAGTA